MNVPEFDLNDPFTLNTNTDTSQLTSKEKEDLLNQMWRNPCVNDTYEPGSTFKTVTAAAALEKGVVSLTDTFSCPGFRIVEDRRIRCHKVGGHGTETFVQASRIPVTRCLSTSDSASAWRIFTTISSSSA